MHRLQLSHGRQGPGGPRRQPAARRPRRRSRPSRSRPEDEPGRESRLDRPRDRVRVCSSRRATSGGRCSARPGGCSATSSGRPTCPGIDWEAVHRPLPPARRPRRDPRGVLGPDLGDAGRAGHVALLRDGRRLPAGAGLATRASSAPISTSIARTRHLEDRAHPARRFVGSEGRLAAGGAGPEPLGGRRDPRRGRPPVGRDVSPPNEWLANLAGQDVLPRSIRSREGPGPRRAGRKGRAAQRTRPGDPRRHGHDAPRRVRLRYRDWVEANRARVHEADERPRRLRPHPRHGARSATPSSTATS